MDELSGVQGVANALSATEWFRPINWNSMNVPGAAVILLGVNVRSVMPFFPAIIVCVLLAPLLVLVLDAAACAAAVIVGVLAITGAAPPPY